MATHVDRESQVPSPLVAEHIDEHRKRLKKGESGRENNVPPSPFRFTVANLQQPRCVLRSSIARYLQRTLFRRSSAMSELVRYRTRQTLFAADSGADEKEAGRRRLIEQARSSQGSAGSATRIYSIAKRRRMADSHPIDSPTRTPKVAASGGYIGDHYARSKLIVWTRCLEDNR